MNFLYIFHALGKTENNENQNAAKPTPILGCTQTESANDLRPPQHSPAYDKQREVP